jgi:glycosyltransferase involved in cell wall biosynthesis
MKDLLTIVIPCKNETLFIKNILSDLNSQYYIDGLKVYVADSSDDLSTKLYIMSEMDKRCDVEIIDGGLPAIARNNGANKVKTPYVLFLDSDMRLTNKMFISNILNEIVSKKGFLLTCKVRTTDRSYDYIYKVFDLIQRLHRITGPFALGGIMLFNQSIFKMLGGFNDEDKIAEDYNISKKIKSNKFVLSKHIILTDSRRFRKKGIWFMVKLMILTFINRNNKNFYKKSFSYWS